MPDHLPSTGCIPREQEGVTGIPICHPKHKYTHRYVLNYADIHICPLAILKRTNPPHYLSHTILLLSCFYCNEVKAMDDLWMCVILFCQVSPTWHSLVKPAVKITTVPEWMFQANSLQRVCVFNLWATSSLSLSITFQSWLMGKLGLYPSKCFIHSCQKKDRW